MAFSRLLTGDVYEKDDFLWDCRAFCIGDGFL